MSQQKWMKLKKRSLESRSKIWLILFPWQPFQFTYTQLCLTYFKIWMYFAVLCMFLQHVYNYKGHNTLQWNLSITDKLVQELLSVILEMSFIGRFHPINVYLTPYIVKDCLYELLYKVQLQTRLLSSQVLFWAAGALRQLGSRSLYAW